MKNTIVWLVVIIVVVVGIAMLMKKPVAVAPVVQEEQQEEKVVTPRSISIPLLEQNSSGVSGVATLTEMGATTVVKLNLTGSPSGVDQPAHIHTGSCATIGGIVYPIDSAVNGVSETTINASLDTILGQLPLALNIHKSATALSVYQACGNLTK